MHQMQNIQSHGFLLALSTPEFRVEAASENTGEFIGFAPGELIGRELHEFLPEARQRLLDTRKPATQGGQACYVGDIAAPGKQGTLAMHIHEANGLAVAEFEPRALASSGSYDLQGPASAFITQLRAAQDYSEVCRLAVRELKEITRFGCVAACVLDDQEQGRVVAEQADTGYERYLGRCHPGADLRGGLSKRCGEVDIRVLRDRLAAPVGLLPPAFSGFDRKPGLDGAALCGITPDISQWMDSVGCRSALVLTIVVQDKFWGLILCRHQSLHPVSMSMRAGCELIGRLVALQIEALERQSQLRASLRQTELLVASIPALQASNQALEAFSHSVSHELRTPLRHILGYAELLAEDQTGALADRGKQFLENIRKSAQSASTIVETLLLFSRIGRAALNYADVNLQALAELGRTEIMSGFEPRNVQWRIAALPVVVADPALMRMVFRNLLSNALKYTRGRDPAIIEIGLQADHDDIVIFVRDNGVGFDMQYSDKLFGVFQRLHRVEEFEGTGIGLASVRRIIEHHDGRVWAHGVPDQGATFCFSLPRRVHSG